MKTTLITALLFSAFSLVGFSQTSEADINPKDPKAKAILDKLNEEFQSFTTIEYDFRYTLKADGVDETQEGKILLKGNKYKLEVAERILISNGTFIYLINEQIQELQINNIDEESDAFMSPEKMLKIYENDMKYRVDGKSKVATSTGSKEGTLIKLHPIDAKEHNFHTMELIIDEAANRLMEMRVKSKTGAVYIYTLLNQKTNVSAADSVFNIDPDSDKFEEYDIIDMTEG